MPEEKRKEFISGLQELAKDPRMEVMRDRKGRPVLVPKETLLKKGDLPLVHGGKIPPAALRWLTEVERIFPGATQDIIIVRNPGSAQLREAGTGGAPIAQEAKNK